jgi:hypothetical protein
MLKYTRFRVLLPERILKEKPKVTDNDFLYMAQKYLVRYPDYRLIRVEGSFAICDRVDESRERRRRK